METMTWRLGRFLEQSSEHLEPQLGMEAQFRFVDHDGRWRVGLEEVRSLNR